MELADKSLADRFEECARVHGTGVPRDELLRYMRETAEVLRPARRRASASASRHQARKPVHDVGTHQGRRLRTRPLLDDGTRRQCARLHPAPMRRRNSSAGGSPHRRINTVSPSPTRNCSPDADPSTRRVSANSSSPTTTFSRISPPHRSKIARCCSRRCRRMKTIAMPSCTAFIDALLESGQDPDSNGNEAATAVGAVFVPAAAAAPPTPVPAAPAVVAAAAKLAAVAAPPSKVDGRTIKPMYTRTASATGSFGRDPSFRGSPLGAKPVEANRRQTSSVELQPHQDKVVNTFVTCVAPELYALKMRAFIDAYGRRHRREPFAERHRVAIPAESNGVVHPQVGEPFPADRNFRQARRQRQRTHPSVGLFLEYFHRRPRADSQGDAARAGPPRLPHGQRKELRPSTPRS